MIGYVAVREILSNRNGRRPARFTEDSCSESPLANGTPAEECCSLAKLSLPMAKESGILSQVFATNGSG